MLAAVHFYHHPDLVTKEVHYVPINRFLPSESQTVYLLCPQAIPQKTFCISLPFAKMLSNSSESVCHYLSLVTVFLAFLGAAIHMKMQDRKHTTMARTKAMR
jgi:hypothetical protein